MSGSRADDQAAADVDALAVRPVLRLPSWPQLGEEEARAVADVVRGNRCDSLGPEVEAFEAEFAAFHGVQHAIAVSNGTTALLGAYTVLGIGPGDEVIVPTHTFVASATPLLMLGATPRFADVGDDDYCIDPEAVARLVTSRTRAVVAVHLNGHPARMSALLEVCGAHGLVLVEDCAQAHGAASEGSLVGTVGSIAAYSFWNDKIMTTGGEGGCVLTGDDDAAERVRVFRNHGTVAAGRGRFVHASLGHNARLTGMQAAIGRVQLRKLSDYLDARRAAAAALTQRLANTRLTLPVPVGDVCHGWWKYVCGWSADHDGPPLAPRLARLREMGVPALPRYPVPLHQQPVFLRFTHDDQHFPVADRLAHELFSLPVHPALAEADIDALADAVAAVFD